MSSHDEYLGKFFAFAYRQLVLALISAAAVASAGLLFAPDASAQLTVGGGGSCTRNTLKCPNSGTTALKPKFCSCPQINVGYCTSCTQACSSSCLGGSTWALFTGAQLPINDPSTVVNEDPIVEFLTGPGDPPSYDITGGPSFRLKCTQGTAECPLGVPAVQSTQQVTFSRSALKIFLSAPIADLPADATPDAPFKVQVAGTSRNDGVYTVVDVDPTGLALTLLEKPNNESATATVALANIKLTFTDASGDESKAKVYFRHFADPVAGQEPQCVAVGGRCEDGVATAVGSFNAQVKCANSGTQLKLPCEVQGFAGKSALALNSQEATFTFPAGEHNFNACGNGSFACAISWSDPDKVTNAVCKKFLPATSEFALCQTLKFTITDGSSITNFKQRAFNSTMADASVLPMFTLVTSTNAPGAVPVDITAGPNPLNAAQGGTISVKVLNNGAADLAKIVVSSVVLTFANYAEGGFHSVLNDQAPESCGGNCFLFKFNRAAVLDAFLAANTSLNCAIPSGTPIPINLVGAYGTIDPGEVVGQDTLTTNQAYTGTCN
jgi:hypothetical protein